jgi:hypothetical protein
MGVAAWYRQFVPDSLLEGAGFELPVPRHSRLCDRDWGMRPKSESLDRTLEVSAAIPAFSARAARNMRDRVVMKARNIGLEASTPLRT